MPQLIPSTYYLLRNKGLNRDFDESWVIWAQEMILAGFESINLYELAGMTKPFYQFEFIELTNRVLTDLHVDYSDNSALIRIYVYFIIKNAIDDVNSYLSVLKKIFDIFLELEEQREHLKWEYYDFFLLYYARLDLDDTIDLYWKGANRENIDSIIKERFQTFIDDYDLNKKPNSYGN